MQVRPPAGPRRTLGYNGNIFRNLDWKKAMFPGNIAENFKHIVGARLCHTIRAGLTRRGAGLPQKFVVHTEPKSASEVATLYAAFANAAAGRPAAQG